MIFIMYQTLSVICFTFYLIDQLITYSDRNNLVFNTVHNGFYYFYCARQYYMDNVYPLYLNYIEPTYHTVIGNTNYFFDKRVFLIENGNVKRSYAFLKQFEDDENNRILNEVDGDDFDFILYRFNDQKPEIMIRFEDLSEVNENFKLLSENPFMSVILVMNNNTHEIKLDEPRNYLVEDNIVLDDMFVQWYCNNELNINYNENYSIDIIDKSINTISINKEKYILLKNNNYKICDINKESDENSYEGATNSSEDENEVDGRGDTDDEDNKSSHENNGEDNDDDNSSLINLASNLVPWGRFYTFTTYENSDLKDKKKK